jgi:phosphohistidine phosphatase
MRQLLLLRHAKSSAQAPGEAAQADHARPLNPAGHAAAASMGGVLRSLNLTPDLVLVSSARRTVQTLEALETQEPWDERPLIEVLDALYLATAPQIMAILNGTAETVRSLMVIGHNPGLHDLALTITGAHALATHTPPASRLAAGFPTGALAEFTVAPAWRDLGEGGGRLVRFLSPKDLPERLS